MTFKEALNRVAILEAKMPAMRKETEDMIAEIAVLRKRVQHLESALRATRPELFKSTDDAAEEEGTA
jgi:hypothetical protein